MKAAIVERYGPPEVVVIRDVPKPEPKDGEVLIKVHATTVNSGDVRIRALRVPPGLTLLMRFALGFSGPQQKILGFDCAGVVEAVGQGVTAFKPGDRVVASRGFEYGCHAEYRAVPADGAIAHIPDGMSDTDAVALLFGGTTALEFFKLGKLKAGETILVNGAAGAVGSVAVQLAKHMGAHVTAVCSAGSAELVRSLGADRVIDYAKEDFTRGSTTYDVIMDNHGSAPYPKIKHLLKPGGRFLMVILANLREMLRRHPAIVTVSDDSANSPANQRLLLELAAKGIIRPVIDSTFAFEDIVAAHRRVDTGHKRGSVVVTVGA